MITFEDGLIMTWRFPLFSALYMLLRASFNTLTLTILLNANYWNINNKHQTFKQKEKKKKQAISNSTLKVQTASQKKKLHHEEDFSTSTAISMMLT